ncbi:translational activator of cytochrome c oxidase 1 [Xenopus laevis]|uniref:Translational activator of cytochrome c oxidase 1 n=2 Tax=Xenopus laevis TaxID=8355 RepID=A0A974BSP9_XENLA|nr:translational activator of cytochrome c oxidase 1 [Xenopus laevis]OCT60067.1 hypothetical protein XELAEV_18046087mg [Xenopus laevis]
MSVALTRICFAHRKHALRLICREPPGRWSLPIVASQGRDLHTSLAASAGHNKWSKVKHIKGPKDEARARIFAKLSMMMKVAVREGGPNPDLNSTLYQLIEQCRERNMPKASIEAAIKGADKAKPSSCVLYEGRGPGGASLLIELLTDNNSRTYAEVKLLMGKNSGVMCDGARHSFDKKGVVTVRSHDRDGSRVPLEKALELAIEAGAEDVQEAQDEEDKDVYKYICDIPSLREVRSSLSSFGLVPISSGAEFCPKTTVQLSDTDMEQASHLLDLLNNHPEVIRVYDNIE